MQRLRDGTSGRTSAGMLVVIALIVVGAWLLRGRDGSLPPAGTAGTAPRVETPQQAMRRARKEKPGRSLDAPTFL